MRDSAVRRSSEATVYDVSIQQAMELSMETRQTMELNQADQRLDVTKSSLSGSNFNDVNLAESTFDNVKLAGSKFNDVNFAESTFDDVNLSGAKIRNATLAGTQIRDASLAGIKITDADLRNAAISDCLIDGMTIEGVTVAEMMAAYRASKA